MAARSLSAPASARWPASAAVTAGWSRRKCTPSTIASTLTAWTGRGRTTAQSSPDQRTMRSERFASTRWNAAMSDSSPTALPSAVPVDDARASEVVRAQLHPHAVAREDADPEPAHLARHVTEDLVAVVELHLEHGVGQGLEDLALELDLLLLGHRRRTLPAAPGTEAAFCGGVPEGLRRGRLGGRAVGRGGRAAGPVGPRSGRRRRCRRGRRLLRLLRLGPVLRRALVLGRWVLRAAGALAGLEA